jgi:hypothetical protein
MKLNSFPTTHQFISHHTMKTSPHTTPTRPAVRRAVHLLLLALAFVVGLAGTHAATGTPPDKMTYQGFLADGTGVPLGNANPANHVTVFRIWPADTGGAAGTALWSEVQTVTVDKGNFSVILGDGLQFGTEAHGALSAVFASGSASDRYLEITVTIGGAPVTIAPRLRLVAAPYALLATSATKLVNPDGSSLLSAPSTGELTVNGNVTAGNVTATRFVGDGSQLTGIAFGGSNLVVPNIVATNRLHAVGSLLVGGAIGATNYRAKLEVNSTAPSFSMSLFGSRWQHGQPPQAANTDWGVLGVGIYSEQPIVSGNFFVSSDARIKNSAGRSDGTSDLATLMGIEVTDYTHKDVIQKGTGKQKKVIAQQVEKIFPQAVTKSSGPVPDIYKPASVKDGWVQLATDLKVGEKVNLKLETGDVIHEVLQVRDGAFRVVLPVSVSQVFVYGREVKDFRTVDYDALAMLNFSATQELARQVEALRKSEARIAELEQKSSHMAALERKVAELEKLLSRVVDLRKDERPAAEAPAAKTGNNQ